MVAKKQKIRVSRRKTGIAAMPTDNFQNSKHYVQYETENREWTEAVKDYCKKSLTKDQLRAINTIPDWKLGFGAHWAVCAHYMTNDIPVPEPYHSKFLERINELVAEGKQNIENTKPKNTNTPNIQQRIMQQSLDMSEPIEEWLEGYVQNPSKFDPSSFDVANHLKIVEASQAHARKIKNMYEGLLEETNAIISLPTQAKISAIKNAEERENLEQLKEGYSHVKKPHAQRVKQALENIIGACDVLIDGAKAKRKPRIPKAPSKEKLIANIKYCVSDDKYQIVSVNPLEIIDSKEIWVFNTKTRKLGKYVADPTSGTIGVKGTSLIGFDETNSVQKTLRKPEETLKEFKKASKVKLRKFLEDINTTDTKMNGRLNSDTVILKVFK